MKITTKGDYATRALQELAMHYNKGPLRIEEIAQRQDIPVRYLEQLLLILKRAGYLESKRGVRGGYALARAPHQITLGEIIRLMEGPPGSHLLRRSFKPREVFRREILRVPKRLGGSQGHGFSDP